MTIISALMDRTHTLINIIDSYYIKDIVNNFLLYVCCTNIHTYIHTYIHTHKYIHTYIQHTKRDDGEANVSSLRRKIITRGDDVY